MKKIFTLGLVLHFCFCCIAQNTWNESVISASGMRGIGYSGSLYVACGASNQLFTSPDANTWTPVTSPLPSTTQLNHVLYTNGMFIVVGGDGGVGKMITSPDGTNWTAQTLPAVGNLFSTAYANGRYVAVGSSGAVITSTNGTTWTSQSVDPFYTFRSVTHILISGYINRFLAVGNANQVFYSDNGGTWQVMPGGGLSPTIYGIVSRNGKLFAAGMGGYIYMSSDNANNWTLLTNSSGVMLTAMALGATDNQIVAVGAGGVVTYTYDLFNWTVTSTGTSIQPLNIIHTGTQFIAVGGTSALKSNNVALPLDILSFNAADNNGVHELSWETASEKNCDHFEVEMSKDGASYQFLGSVRVHNLDHSTYTFRTGNNDAGTYFYRLKLVNADGSTHYSSVRTVTTAAPDEGLNIYPNPAKGVIRIEGADALVNHTISDAQGRMFSATRTGNSIDISTLHPGIYFLSAQKNGSAKRIKFIVD